MQEVAVNGMTSGPLDSPSSPRLPAALPSAPPRVPQDHTAVDAGGRPPAPSASAAPADRAFLSQVIAGSERMSALFPYLESVSATSLPVLITGEAGVGKERLARGIHALSRRAGAFVVADIATLDPAAFAATLFGLEGGGLAGAARARAGLLETAAHGTLLLDDIGDLPKPLQVCLLRLLESGEYLPLGADRPKFMTTRVIAATNRDLRRLRDEGRFRPDLYYRLCTHHVHIAPLRERREELPLLIEHFLERAAAALGKRRPSAPPGLLALLESYPFPGNVRELEAMVFDAVGRQDGPELSLETFREAIACHGAAPTPTPVSAPAGGEGQAAAPPPAGLTFGERLPQAKGLVDALIDEALRRTKGNQTLAAHLVGVTRQALNSRLRKRRQGGPAAP